MVVFEKILDTKNKTKGVNTCQFVIWHHTATAEGTVNGVINDFCNGNRASCHYTIDELGKIYKIGNDKDILWHAGESSWGKYNMLNNFSIGIEVIGPLKNGGFTDQQRESLKNLTLELCQKYAIPKENVLRHKDIAPGRKVDIADSFWNGQAKSFEDYKNIIFIKNGNMSKSKYTDIMESVLKEGNLKPIFDKHEGDYPLKEQEVKELIEIAIARVKIANKLK